jgi:2-dehydro-3-deoxyphosphogluconate aldolase/(4S)-4-hydroxy-2-oxoglutarate aldolase
MEAGPAGPLRGAETTDAALSAIQTAGIVPVVVLDDADAAEPLADALLDSGLHCVEITMRTPAGLPALRNLASRPGLTVGAGTVLDEEQVDRCMEFGAGFVVSPGFDDAVVARCRTLGVPILPGTATASEILRARRRGLSAVKFFPAESSGGLPAIEALAAAIHGIRFMPTGGIGPEDVERYLRSKAVLAVGGSWVVPRELLAQREWGEIRNRCARAAQLAALYARPPEQP